MSKTTQHQTSLPTRFKLKPLLVAIPFSVLAACANNQGTTITEDQSQAEITTPYIDDHEQNNTVAEANIQADKGPDLTVNEYAEEQAPDTHATSQLPEPDSSLKNNDRLVDGTQEGSDPMTVLVIENPETLSKLASANITQVNTPQPDTSSESLNRPGKRVFHFGFNQSSLSEEDIDLIEQHAAYLKANPELQVTIHGHTDAQGNANYNLKLSQQRASMMVSELIKQGINKDRIKTIGWGGGYPLVSTLNFAENRRIEIEYSAIHYAANQ